jgi:serine/threonine-protein kinase
MRSENELLPPRYLRPTRIGYGGMGEIFRAEDEVLGRTVAIKVLSEQYARDESLRARFTREALAAARLSGEPDTVTIFDVGEWEGRPFIVMEYLGGGSLEARLREGAPPPVDEALLWLEQAARALDSAHQQGVVHRDVKPGNLLLDSNGDLRVADFGIASAAGLHSLTLTGTVLGTAGYLSPEQARGERATPASDRRLRTAHGPPAVRVREPHCRGDRARAGRGAVDLAGARSRVPARVGEGTPGAVRDRLRLRCRLA